MPDTGIGVGEALPRHLAGEDHPGQVLDVDLVHDAGAGRDDLEVVEGGLAPAQELVALAVAAVLDLDVADEGVGGSEDVGDDGVVDHHLRRGQRVDLGGVTAQVGHRLPHGGQVDHARHTGEVLHDHPGRGELDLLARLGARIPRSQSADVVGGDVRTVLGSQQVLQQDLQAVGQLLRTLDGIQPEDLVRLVADIQRGFRTETVDTHEHSSGSSRKYPVIARREGW